MIKPGWQTSEYWTTVVAQVISLLAILGAVQGPDAATLQDALGKCITAVFVLASNSWVVVRYIQSRTQLKQGAGRTAGAAPFVLLPWLALAAIGGPPAPAHAAPPPGAAPARVSTCFFARRPPPRDDTALLALMQQMIGLQQQSLANQQLILTLLHQRQPAAPAQPAAPVPPAAPIIIQHHYAPPPLQELPIAGRPRQDLPVEGKPRQDLPIAGPPRQELPGPGKPRQDLPGPGRPHQDLPDAAPKQELPAAPAMPPATSGRPLPMQRYTLQPTLRRPALFPPPARPVP